MSFTDMSILFYTVLNNQYNVDPEHLLDQQEGLERLPAEGYAQSLCGGVKAKARPRVLALRARQGLAQIILCCEGVTI